jgi:hypothetical protein
MGINVPQPDEAFEVECIMIEAFRASKPQSWEQFEIGVRAIIEQRPESLLLEGIYGTTLGLDYATDFVLSCIKRGIVLFIEKPGFEVPPGVVLYGPSAPLPKLL